MSMFEPRIWSHITDCLPEDHPLRAHPALACGVCGHGVHVDNECMDTWVETGRGIYCFGCFVEAIKVVTPAHTTDSGRVVSEEVFYCLDREWALTFGADQDAG